MEGLKKGGQVHSLLNDDFFLVHRPVAAPNNAKKESS